MKIKDINIKILFLSILFLFLINANSYYKTYANTKGNVYLEYVSDTSTSLLSEVRIHGKATNENKEVLRTGTIDEILGIEPYDKTSYATEITEAE